MLPLTLPWPRRTKKAGSFAPPTDGGAGMDVPTGTASDAANTPDAAAGVDASSAVYSTFLTPLQSFIVLPPGSECSAQSGLSTAPSPVAETIVEYLGSATASVVCVLDQLPAEPLMSASCAASTVPGWCYVTGPVAGQCPEALALSPGSLPPGPKQRSGATERDPGHGPDPEVRAGRRSRGPPSGSGDEPTGAALAPCRTCNPSEASSAPSASRCSSVRRLPSRAARQLARRQSPPATTSVCLRLVIRAPSRSRKP